MKIMPLIRTVHIYLTMLALVPLLFIAATGLLLNHESWLAGLRDTRVADCRVPTELLADPIRQEAVVERLRQHCGVVGSLTAFSFNPDEVTATFRTPTGRTEVVIYRFDGQAEVKRRPLLGFLTDLHRGKTTGVWKLLVDATGAVLAAAVVTGLILWISLPRRRVIGLLAAVLGLAVWGAVYLFRAP